jgi:DNA-binding protein H-NS
MERPTDPPFNPRNGAQGQPNSKVWKWPSTQQFMPNGADRPHINDHPGHAMSTLAEIRAQMALLKQQEAEVLKTERVPLINKMKEDIEAYDITAFELGFESQGDQAAKVGNSTKGKKASPVKYRDGDKTWAGHGRKPAWVIEKLGASEDIEKYRVN